MKGRKPKPTKLKILTGNPGKRPLNEQEPAPEGIPKCPECLSDRAQAEWQRLVPQLIAAGLATAVDEACLTAYCTAVADLLETEQALAREGFTYTTMQGQIIARPEVAIRNAARKTIKEFASLFGLDPSSRSRLQVPSQGSEEDELEQFLQGA
jgi:P27 family predicted phage terminase small subunit